MNSTSQPFELDPSHGTKLTWGSLLSKTYGLYRDDFWIFLRAGLPAGILVYLFKPIDRSLVHLLYNWIASTSAGPAWRLNPLISVPVLTLQGFIEGAFYWLISAVFFAAIAARVNSEQQDAPLSDAYSPVRPRIRSLLVVGIITWSLFFVGRGLSNSIMFIAFNKFHPKFGFLASLAIFSSPLLIVAGLISRLGLAVPELMNNSAISVREAIRASAAKTENWEPFFMFFLAKSAIVGYAVYWLAQRGFNQLWRRTSISETAYYWVAWAVYVCIFAMLESPLFIAFSLLYRESEFKQDAFTAPAIG